ncbi:MAG: ribonuclease J [Acidobacteria bacterium]|nr:ribonuclease J [Acidobacteriota bacterium]
MQDPHVDIIPFGGLGEFGMNTLLLRSGNQGILIDAGIMFPGDDLLGVDFVAPDFTYLRETSLQLLGIILTHGHEDHIGGIPYLLPQHAAPIYGTRLTLALLAGKLREHGLISTAHLHTVKARDRTELGPFHLEFIHVTHSIPDSMALAIETPAGVIVHTGDFKFDQSPIDGQLTDFARLNHYGERGVRLLLSDSTNSERTGFTPSEASLRSPLEEIFLRARKKVVASCFASSLHRIQIFLDLAQQFDRKVAPVGRSMSNAVNIGLSLGYLRAADGLIIGPAEVKFLPLEKVLVLSSGSQGEPMSALSRLAVNEFKGIYVEPEDIVILSTRVIPGNERRISNTVNHLSKRGAIVLDERMERVHVSGHASQEEQKLMISMIRPHFFVPVHGEYRQLKFHAEIARGVGVAEERIRILEDGDCLRLAGKEARLQQKLPIGRRFLDEEMAGEIHDMVLQDRRFLSEDGFVVAILKIDRGSGKLQGPVELISRGFLHADESAEFFEEARGIVRELVANTPIEEKQDETLLKDLLRKSLKKLFYKQTQKRPIILPVILEA